MTGDAPAGVRRVNLGGLGLVTSKTSTKYPTLPDPTGVIAHAVDQYCAEYATFEALEGCLKTIKGEFSGWARPFYYQSLTGRLDIPSSVLALSSQIKSCSRFRIVTRASRLIGSSWAKSLATICRTQSLKRLT